ncbi:unnamed protein product [Medioppia subpectinata]|uniref:Uncharacterized protein n=1 Tax=Medioppia subpectinata TaxID=1979941 RepID=A0A7R9KZ87_9ACAR|nr:unnamed protein product [Medioppia subpectinata]CAG2112627.1 unnamed protein product [Medioppia subpectinata]
MRQQTQHKGSTDEEVIQSDIESNDGIDCDINVESDNETIDGTVDESVVTNQTQDITNGCLKETTIQFIKLQTKGFVSKKTLNQTLIQMMASIVTLIVIQITRQSVEVLIKMKT